MQNDLERRLSELARVFREATNLRLGDATRRALRENTAQAREISELLKLCRTLDEELQNNQEELITQQLESSLYEAQNQLVLEKLNKFSEKTKNLSNQYSSIMERTGIAMRGEKFTDRTKQAMEEKERIITKFERNTRILQQNIQVTKDRKERFAQEARDNSVELEKLYSLINDIEDCVREALQVCLNYTLQIFDFLKAESS